MAKAPPPVPSQAAYLLDQAVKRSRRSSGIQLPIGFVRAVHAGQLPPVAAMLRGGRGGEVRLKLFLTLVLVAARKPYAIREVPAHTWAEMLGLNQPETLGARRIADALHWLSRNAFIELDSKRGRPPVVKLRDATGKGQPFSRGRGVYVGVPIGLWEHYWIVRMSGSALALLLVLLDLQGGKTPTSPPTIAAARKRRYGLSEDTWTRASQELSSLGLLTITKKTSGDVFDMRRLRNAYWISKAALSAAPPGSGSS